MQVDLFNGMAYEKGIFNEQRNTNTQSGKDKLKEDILFLLTQEKGKFYPDPDFGSELQKYMFEPMTEILGKKMQQEIQELISKYYPQINIKAIDITMYSLLNKISINISYTYADSEVDIDSIAFELFNQVN